MSDETIMYVGAKLHKSLAVSILGSVIPVDLSTLDSSIVGCVLVYKTREDAIKAGDGCLAEVGERVNNE